MQTTLLKTPLLLVALAVGFPAWGAEQSSVIQPGATLQKLAGGFKFTEGATCDPAGHVFFVDQPNNRIHRWDVVKRELSTWMDPAGRANGMSFDARGNLIACADETNALWSITPDQQITVLLHEYEGNLLNGPNDVWVHPDGSLYLTDPFYKRPWWTHTEPPQGGRHVYRLSADRKTLRRLTEAMDQPNGIVGTADGTTLFVAEIGAGRIWQWNLQPDGSLADKQLFCEAKSDGMTLDAAGNLYTTSNGVWVFDKHGKHVETIEVPERWVGNVCFGGQERRTLFITASTGLYSIELRHRGALTAK
jgi:gluconolactonase